MRRPGFALACAPWICLFGACIDGGALTAKATPLDVRYFSPESVGLHDAGAREQAGQERARVRLGRLTSSANLRTRIVHRESNVELDAYDSLRWTENPEAYVRRALSRALFEDRPLQQAVGGAAPTLDVELVAFEEVHDNQRRAGRVQLRYQLHDEQTVFASGLVTMERDASGAEIENVVAAIGAAMTAAAAQVAMVVVKSLCNESP